MKLLKKLLTLAVTSLIAFSQPALAGYKPGGGSSAASPFAPAGFANVSALAFWHQLAISPDGAYVYITGELASNNHAAIVKVKVADGSVAGTFDVGANNTTFNGGLAVSPDGSAVYAIENHSTNTWYKISTSNMTLTHSIVLAGQILGSEAWDLSPDGSTYAGPCGLSDNVYAINTSTYVVSTIAVGHSDGGSVGVSSVCWYNGSSSNFYVAYYHNSSVDLYSAGSYTSTVNTGAGGTPSFIAMRSGINGNFYIADEGTNLSIIQVAGGTPFILGINGPIRGLVVNTHSQTAIADGGDNCYFAANLPQTGTSSIYEIPSSGVPSVVQILSPWSVAYNGASGLDIFPDTSERLFTLSGALYSEVWSMASVPDVTYPGSLGNIKISDGKGSWLSAPPFSTTGWTGSDTIGGGGTVTITTAVATTSSIISVSPTGTANVLPPAVTTKSAGSFVVTGTGTGTFDWVLLKP